DCFHSMDQPWRNVKGLPLLQTQHATVSVIFDRQPQFAVHNKERFLFHFVILQTETFSAIHVQDLADIPVRLRKNQLVTPRLGNPMHISVTKQMIVAHALLCPSPSGKRMATLSMTNSSISCAVFFCNATSAIRRQSR